MKKNKHKKAPSVVKPFVSDNLVKYTAIAVFSISLLLSVNYTFKGIHNYLLDNHSFRQTQTALTAFYFVKDGYQIDYETPIAGAPWAIPFEFPFYQWVVAVIKSVSDSSLDFIGRIVSIVFYWLSLLVLYKLINKYTSKQYETLFIISFILLHPIYIFWSRTFMIESTVLFFSLLYIYYSLRYIEENNKIALALAMVSGTLAALVKITTFAPITFFLFGIIVWRWYNEKGYRLNLKINLKYVLYGILLFIIPVLIAKGWVDYSDDLKKLNEYAYEFTSSKKLNNWNFGTFEQKTSFETWKRIFQNSQLFSDLFYVSLIAGIITAFVLKLKYRLHIIICLLLYVAAPLVFTNLHMVHDYYTYANSFLLCMAIGFLSLSFIEREWILYKLIGIVYAIAILTFFTNRYKEGYFKSQSARPDFLIPITNIVKQTTKPDDVILVYGNDWGSEYAYYSERRTIALRNTFTSVKDSAFVNLMKQNEQYNVNTLVFVTYTGLFNNQFVNELIPYLGFQPLLQKEPFFIFQKPKD